MCRISVCIRLLFSDQIAPLYGPNSYVHSYLFSPVVVGVHTKYVAFFKFENFTVKFCKIQELSTIHSRGRGDGCHICLPCWRVRRDISTYLYSRSCLYIYLQVTLPARNGRPDQCPVYMIIWIYTFISFHKIGRSILLFGSIWLFSTREQYPNNFLPIQNSPPPQWMLLLLNAH